MGYKYNVKDITANSIVNGREYDIAYGNYVQTINGDFDRENIRTDAIAANACAENCFGEMFLVSNQSPDVDDITFDALYTTTTPEVKSGLNPRGNGIPGFGIYDIDGGGKWIEATSTTKTTQTGMLEIAWRCNIYQPKVQSFNKFSFNGDLPVERRWMKWQIRLNGVPICESDWIVPMFWTVELTTAVPVGGGDNTISVYWWVPHEQGKDPTSFPITNGGSTVGMWWGGQLAMHNRRR